MTDPETLRDEIDRYFAGAEPVGPDNEPLKRCRSCNAPVMFVGTVATNGRVKQILNPDVDMSGSIFVRLGDRLCTVARTDQLEKLRAGKIELKNGWTGPYLDHHATCPDAKAWRERSAGRRESGRPHPAPSSEPREGQE